MLALNSFYRESKILSCLRTQACILLFTHKSARIMDSRVRGNDNLSFQLQLLTCSRVSGVQQISMPLRLYYRCRLLVEVARLADNMP